MRGVIFALLLFFSFAVDATYLPRKNELREEILEFKKKIQGTQQDRMDFAKFKSRIRKIMADYRRLYPDKTIEAEDDVVAFYYKFKTSFDFFEKTQKPTGLECTKIISRINAEATVGKPTLDEDETLLAEITKKLCATK